MWLYDVFFAVVTGFMGSLLVVVFLYRLRPKIEISKFIAEQHCESDITYGFKLINRTPYPLVDISVELVLVTSKNVPGGTVFAGREVPLIRDRFFDLGRFDVKDKEAHYALRIGCAENLRAIWTSESQNLRLSVIAKHSLSGFSKVVSQTFHTFGDIKVGKHRAGNDLSVEAVV